MNDVDLDPDAERAAALAAPLVSPAPEGETYRCYALYGVAARSIAELDPRSVECLPSGSAGVPVLRRVDGRPDEVGECAALVDISSVRERRRLCRRADWATPNERLLLKIKRGLPAVPRLTSDPGDRESSGVKSHLSDTVRAAAAAMVLTDDPPPQGLAGDVASLMSRLGTRCRRSAEGQVQPADPTGSERSGPGPVRRGSARSRRLRRLRRTAR